MTEPASQPRPSPSVPEIAVAALSILGRKGERRVQGAGAEWGASCHLGGLDFAITCSGPDLPQAIEPTIASGALIASQRLWAGTYRLVVRVRRLIVLDLHWKPGEPTRIMGFSRGDWESALLDLARG